MKDGLVERSDVLGDSGEWDADLYLALYARAESVAREINLDFPMVEVDDLVQEALIWAIKHPEKVSTWMEHPDGIGRVKIAMRNFCKDYAVAERARQRGDDGQTDDVWYSTDALKGTGKSVGKRGLLHLVFDESAWTNPDKTETETKVKRDPAEGNNWLATLSDVSAALDKLKVDDPKAHALIELHFHQGYTYVEIGEALEPPVTDTTVGRRMDRAVKKVHEFLGGPRPHKDPAEEGWQDGPGTRYVITNAAARAITDNSYGE